MTRLPIFGTIGLSFRIFFRAPWKFLGLILFQILLGSMFSILAAFLKGEPYQPALRVGAQVFGYIIQVAISGAIAVGVAEIVAYGDFDFEEALGTGFRRFPATLAVLFLQTVVFFVAFLLFVIPGVIAAIMFGLALPICAIEALGPIRSMDCSKALTVGHRWSMFGLSLAILAVALVTGVAVFGLAKAKLLIVAIPIGIVLLIALVILGSIMPTALFLQLRAIHEGTGAVQIPARLD